jgi:hypothetical protein
MVTKPGVEFAAQQQRHFEIRFYSLSSVVVGEESFDALLIYTTHRCKNHSLWETAIVVPVANRVRSDRRTERDGEERTR